MLTPEILLGSTSPDSRTDAEDGGESDDQSTDAADERGAVAGGRDMYGGDADGDDPGEDAEASHECDCDPLTAAGVPPLPERPWLNWVGPVSPELAHRLACDAIVWRVALDPRTGLPLDVGRKHRIVPWWIRKALWARDRACRWPGCDIPAEWTDAHHIIPWWAGGTTEISALLSFCRYHHGLVHEGHWTLRLDPATGEAWITRPDGTPYELGPSRPWTSPSHQGPRPGAPPGSRPPPTTQRPRSTDPPDVTRQL